MNGRRIETAATPPRPGSMPKTMPTIIPPKSAARRNGSKRESSATSACSIMKVPWPGRPFVAQARQGGPAHRRGSEVHAVLFAQKVAQIVLHLRRRRQRRLDRGLGVRPRVQTCAVGHFLAFGLELRIGVDGLDRLREDI